MLSSLRYSVRMADPTSVVNTEIACMEVFVTIICQNEDNAITVII
jgi:hypothetical protein